MFFFFQAEDGIRDLVRSRGLGDVYKRQMKHWVAMLAVMSVGVGGAGVAAWPRVAGAQAASALSLIHI